ncbi:HAD family hydrolase [Desulfovibrio inopinatus]|uniref:HAD family hydrolase n=1 Tax=Desulfovibrio inopinatus TaxID=102109 RepID=UPI0004841EF1|nr:HAD family hydrolase [Desulfovibrio inopinatus]
MKTQAIIFDLDGTLLNTLTDIANAINVALSMHNLPTHPENAYRTMIGNGLEKLVERALGPQNTSYFSVVLADAHTEYGKRLDQATAPYPGINAMLADLVRMGLPLAILSNKPHDLTLDSVKTYFPETPFAVVAGAKPNVPLKPSADAALAICQELSVSPNQTIFVGDSQMDIKTAVNAGMFGAGVSWGFRDREELLQAGASVVINRPDELLALL